VVVVDDPMYRDEELTALGLVPYQKGSPVDAAVLHTDHAAYRQLSATDLPGVRTVVDGRGVLDPAHWPDVTLRVVGRG
jgi:UDP-N-acetyl-D-mannosaminuronate dehydrogenase